MTAKTGKYAWDKLFYATSRENYPTTVQFMYLTHHKVEAIQVLNGTPCSIYEEILTNPNNFIKISGNEIATMGIWDKEKRTFTNPNELNNEDAIEGMSKGTGIMALDLDHDPQYVSKNKMGKFDDANLQKPYKHTQGKYDETVIIASRSRQIGGKLQPRTEIAPPPGFNI